MSTQAKIYSGKEVAEHNTRQSCWIIVHGECQSGIVVAPVRGDCVGKMEETEVT